MISENVVLAWVIAVIALLQRRCAPLAVFAILWDVVIVVFGLRQVSILPGGAHWIVRVVHLIVGLSAIPIAERLTRAPVSYATT